MVLSLLFQVLLGVRSIDFLPFLLLIFQVIKFIVVLLLRLLEHFKLRILSSFLLF